MNIIFGWNFLEATLITDAEHLVHGTWRAVARLFAKDYVLCIKHHLTVITMARTKRRTSSRVFWYLESGAMGKRYS